MSRAEVAHSRVATEGHPYPAETDVWVALDLDGTLIDAQTRQVELARFHLLKFGEALDGAELWAKKREGASTRAVLDAMGFSSAAEVAAAWGQDIESREWLERDRWLPGVCEVLERLRAEGVGLRVVTARQDEGALREQLETLGVTARVDEVVVVDPRRAAIEKAEFLKGAALFVGDTESDAEAAKLAGVPFVAVSTGVRSRAFLEQRGLVVADSLEEALTVGFFTAGRGGASLGGEGVP